MCRIGDLYYEKDQQLLWVITAVRVNPPEAEWESVNKDGRLAAGTKWDYVSHPSHNCYVGNIFEMDWRKFIRMQDLP